MKDVDECYVFFSRFTLDVHLRIWFKDGFNSPHKTSSGAAAAAAAGTSGRYFIVWIIVEH